MTPPATEQQEGTVPPEGSDLVVCTRSGAVRGARQGGIACWRAIPYAAPPEGALRFRDPQPAPVWVGVRDARRFGPAAPQPFSLPERVLGFEGTRVQAEDCLTLNLWSPGPGGALRPVMVWVHGGSFLTGAGSDPLYDGAALARRGDVVVVTFNYRLGALGFLHLGGLGVGAEEAAENVGLRDMLAVLRWLRDNVAAFGGDPGCVTLFGQSAGAMAIGTLLGAPAARGLFHRAILQSGAARHVHGRAAATAVARAMLRALGLRRPDLAALRAMPVARLVAAGEAVGRRVGALALPFQPVIDGALLPIHPLAAVRAGSAAHVPMLIGTTRHELALYAAVAREDPAPALVKGWRRLAALAGIAGAFGPARLLALRRLYGEGETATAAFVGDLVFGMPALALADSQAGHAPVFQYRFDWPSPAQGGRLAACHAAEVPFVWGQVGTSAARHLAPAGAAAQRLAEAVQEAWIAFARCGDPAAPGLGPWPRHDPGAMTLMRLDERSGSADDPRRPRRAAWRTGEAEGLLTS